MRLDDMPESGNVEDRRGDGGFGGGGGGFGIPVGSGGLGSQVPPQVPSVVRKPLSIAFEEIAADKIVPVYGEELAARREAEAAEVAARIAAAESQE